MSEEKLTVRECSLCCFAYDKAPGISETKLLAGALWKGVSEDQFCPGCVAAKREFVIQEIG